MKKTCPNCKHSEWETTAKGRRKLQYNGNCNYPAIVFPWAYVDHYGDMPKKRSIHGGISTDLKPCPMWEKLK